MSLAPAEQDDLYTRFWNPIEEFTKYDPSSFVRDYLTMKQGKIGRIDKIYFIFKEYAETANIDGATLLEDMHHYAKIYSQVDNAKVGTDKLNRKLNQLRTLDSTIAYPFFMAFFDYATKVGLAETEIYQVLDVIEAYWARRIICNLPSNALNKVFATLHRDVLNHVNRSSDETSPSYIDVLKYVLLKKGRSSVFPSDEEVKGDFKTRQVYKMPVNARMFILERMENQDNNERHDVVKELTEKNITIEHIMPQTLSDKWKATLGEDWERIHEQYLHTMANLTLTGYNSQYSNLTFIEKRDMEKGFKDSAFRLNNSVKSCEQWTETELKARQKELQNVFMRLWPMPTTSFEPLSREAESASLDDEYYEFTGKKLQAYMLHGVRYTVNTWKEMLIQVCGHILIEKRSTIEWLCANEKCSFSATPEEWRRELAPDMFLQRKTIAVKYDDALDTLDGDENKLKHLITFGVIVQTGDSLELDDAYQRFFEEVLAVNEDINISSVKMYIDKLNLGISSYLAAENNVRRESFMREIRHTFKSIDNATRRNVIDLKRIVDDTYKQEPNFKIKELRLKDFDEKARLIGELIRQTEHVIDEQTIFFSSVSDYGLKQTVSEVRDGLRESAHGLIAITAQIIEYLNRIEYQSRLVKRVRQLKYLRDQFMIEQATNVKEVMAQTNTVWMESKPKYVTRVSLDFLRNEDSALEILDNIRKRLSKKANIKSRLAEKIDESYLEEQTETARAFNHQELLNGFLAQSSDLFYYLWNYSFTETPDKELRLVLFLQMASQYPEQMRFTTETKTIENIEYPIIYPR